MALRPPPPLGSTPLPAGCFDGQTVIVTGGELTLNMLDLRYNVEANFYQAPIHFKANGGVFLIDDFGHNAATMGWLDRAIDEAGIRDRTVTFTALHDAMPNYMRAADIVVMPSIIKEQYGRVAPEAMACETAVIVSDAGALPELVGDAGIIVPQGDVVALAKALSAYAKTTPAFVFKAGLVEGRVIDVKSIGELATMPSKEEIYAKLLYVIQAPAQQLVTAMNGVGRNLAVVVDQGVKENKFQG